MKINTFLFFISLFTPLFLHAQPTYNLADTVLAKRYLDESKGLINSARYNAALEKLDSAEWIYMETAGKESMEYADVLNGKGNCFYYTFDYNKAGDFYFKALEIRLKKIGPEHLIVAGSYNNLGNVHKAKGEYDRATEFHQKALAIRLKNLGPEHPLAGISYSNLGNVCYANGDYDGAAGFYQKALEIQLKTRGREHPEVGGSYNNLGNVYEKKGDYDYATELYQNALEIWLKTLGPGHPNIMISYGNLGNVYYAKGDYERALEFNQMALAIILKTTGPRHPSVAGIYNGLGNVYYLKGDYDRSTEYYQKAVEIRIKTFGPEHLDIADYYHNMGNIFEKKGDFQRAVDFFQRALKIKKKILDPQHPSIAASYQGLGNVCYAKKDYDDAAGFYQEALEIHLNKSGYEYPDVAMLYNSLGNVFRQKNDYQQSVDYLQKALEIQLKTLPAESIETARTYLNLVRSYASMGNSENFKNAEPLILKAFQALHYVGTDSFRYVKSLPLLIGSLASKGQFYRGFYLTTRELHYLQTARHSFAEARSAVAYQRKNLERSDSKSILSKDAASVFEGGIDVNHLLYELTDSLHYLQEAFHYTEQSKALDLYESIKNADALHLAGIPDSLLQKEYDLRVDIAYYEKRRQELYSAGKEETDSAMLRVTSRLFDLNRAYESLIHTFETNYPDYYRLKFDLHVEDIPDIQRSLLQPGQAMLMYHAGDSSVFIFLIKKDDYRIFEVKKDFPLEDWVRQLGHSIYGYRQEPITDIRDAVAAKEYAEAASDLYNKLLSPVDSLLPRRVIIIPDGILGYVPFEALLTEKPDQPQRFQSHAYFSLKHDLSYCYSATLLREMIQKQHKKEPERPLAAFAPFDTSGYRHLERLTGNIVLETLAHDTATTTNRKDFKPLPKSGEEVSAISKIWQGVYFLNSDATEPKFSQMAGDYRILHLATHGQADSRAGDYSFLAFAQITDTIENDLLYVREVYNLSLNADLVTLSACETSTGELKRGEGIISLARAFSYAGAKSIVATLWSVEDARTKNLMITFYKNLKLGMDKDAALAEAQRRFLSTGENAHPYFWAGFVAIGDMEAVRQ